MTQTDITRRRGPTSDDVWRALGAPLQTFVRKRIADPDAAADVVSDVMLRIHQHLDHLDDHEKVTAWMFRIARNAIVDHYRRVGRRPELVADGLDELAGGSETDHWVDDQAGVIAELAVVLRPLVDQLPDDYRRALELTDLGGMTQAEAARIEHMSVSGMKSRVQRGRRQLAVLLDQHCRITLDATGMPSECAPRTDGCSCGVTPPDR
jgi:RNA polymerase sigma-70 factor (ECF subfamily)